MIPSITTHPRALPTPTFRGTKSGQSIIRLSGPQRVGRAALDRTGTNLPAVGEYNQTVVLDAIRRRPEGITRSELAALTALSGMTVTKVCRRLLDAGLVEEVGTRTSGPGKPAAVVTL